MASLDDMIGSTGSAPSGGDETGSASEGSPDEENGEDEFTMHAEDFLDDSLPMPQRVEALRNAILSVSTPPTGTEDSGVDLGSLD